MGSEREADYYVADRARGLMPYWDGLEFFRIWKWECLLRTHGAQWERNGRWSSWALYNRAAWRSKGASKERMPASRCYGRSTVRQS